MRRSPTHKQPPQLVDALTLVCTKAGFSPRIIAEPANMQTMLIAVATGIGVSLTPTCVGSFHQPGVTLIPIQPDPPPLEIVAGVSVARS